MSGLVPYPAGSLRQKVCIRRHTTIGGLNSFYRIKGRSYDVGLHAVTNYLSSRAAKRGPMIRLLRQLRIQWEELSLSPQIGSTIAFPGVRLDFSNDFELFQSQVARQFPRQKDNLRRLLAELIDYDDLGRVGNGSPPGGRRRIVVIRCCQDDILPAAHWGARARHGMGQFSVMFP